MRTQRSLLTFSAGTLSQLVIPLAGLVATPLILRWLGAERFGAYRVTLDWLGYLLLLELGFQNSLLSLLARAAGSSQSATLESTVAMGVKTYLRIALAMGIAGTLLVLFIPRLVPVSTQHVADLQIGCFIGLLTVIFVPLYPFRSLLMALQKGYLVESSLFLQQILILALAVFFVWGGWGIKGQMFALLIGQIPSYIFFVWYAIRSYPGILGNRVTVDQADLVKNLWKLNWPNFVFVAYGRITLCADNIVIALVLNPAAIAPFFLTQRLVQLAATHIQGIGNASWAGITEIHFQEQHDLFNRRVVELTKLVVICGVAICMPICAYNHHFIRLWVGSHHFAGEWLTFLAVANAIFQSIFSLWGWCFTGTGTMGHLAPTLIVGGVLNLGLSILFTFWLGMIGPLLGTFLTVWVVLCVLLTKIMERVFGVRSQELLKAIFVPLGWGFAAGAGAWLFAHSHSPGGWLGLAGEMGAIGCLFGVFAWFFCLNELERQLWTGRVRQLLWPAGQ
ncbi:MAG: oligosaccharide flippase family protein [Deltaproteobacteria bacterium]|nr:oligosaccharide flippase family protein [Deltaproteobacteria bacterium]